MNEPILIALGVELVLVMFTLFLLLQPQTFFGKSSATTKGFVTFLGIVMVGLVFCWSVVFGALLYLNRIRVEF